MEEGCYGAGGVRVMTRMRIGEVEVGSEEDIVTIV